jgi:PTH1 family peptidyl-tRNA hydrolase
MPENSPQSDTYLVVGLGNPGPKYAGTRHNIGFVVVEELARRHGLSFSQKQANAEVARSRIAGTPVILAKPLTYMNDSGRAVQALARYYKVPNYQVLVVYDDFALPLGTLRIREKGSAGGHNGVTSIIQHLGTQGFPRLRVGVDRPVQAQHSTVDWVLGRFTKDEQAVMQPTVPRAAEAIEAILRDGIERAMNQYNAGEDAKEPRNKGKAEQKGLGVRDQGLANDRPPTNHDEEIPNPQSPTPNPKANRWVEKLRSIYGKEVKAE